MDSFWSGLTKPFFVLAPLADVTDPAYRRLIAQHGPPDVMWTEFISADGLFHTRERKRIPDEENPLVRDLAYTPGEHPILAQMFGSNPDTIRYAAALAAERGFDGFDINMGCPDRSIEKQGAGAAMIKTPEKVAGIVSAAREGAARAGKPHLPVSIKTRIGYNRETLDEWLPVVLAARPDAITLHLRTRKEMSKVEAHWELMARAVAMRDRLAPDVLMLGNGDVKDLADARAKASETGADGIMLGRAIFGNPWLFTDRDAASIAPREKLEALLTLARYFSELRPAKSFHLLKKHFKAFVHGWPGAAEMRATLMETNSFAELEPILTAMRELV